MICLSLELVWYYIYLLTLGGDWIWRVLDEVSMLLEVCY